MSPVLPVQMACTILQQYQPSLIYDTLSEKMPPPRAGRSEIAINPHRPTKISPKIFNTPVGMILALFQRYTSRLHIDQSVEQVFFVL
ncbi:MAG: hypothetical protein OEY57_01150 [Nitrospirota bacterium]|nr:hypothetical protein [Nitrospirota bacterium]